MALLTVVQSKRADNGINLAGVAAAAGGDTFPTTGVEALVIRNGGAGAITLTVITPGNLDGLAIADLTASIGVGETRMLGPFAPAVYAADGQPGGNVALGYSAVASVTVAVVKI